MIPLFNKADYVRRVLQKMQDGKLDRNVALALVARAFIQIHGETYLHSIDGIDERLRADAGISEDEARWITPDNLHNGIVLAADGILALKAEGFLNERSLWDVFGAIESGTFSMTAERIRELAKWVEAWRPPPFPRKLEF